MVAAPATIQAIKSAFLRDMLDPSRSVNPHFLFHKAACSFDILFVFQEM